MMAGSCAASAAHDDEESLVIFGSVEDVRLGPMGKQPVRGKSFDEQE